MSAIAYPFNAIFRHRVIVERGVFNAHFTLSLPFDDNFSIFRATSVDERISLTVPVSLFPAMLFLVVELRLLQIMLDHEIIPDPAITCVDTLSALAKHVMTMRQRVVYVAKVSRSPVRGSHSIIILLDLR
jgi:hypothetical protein